MNYYKHKENNRLFLAVKGNQMKIINLKSGITSKKQKISNDYVINYELISRDDVYNIGIDVKSLERFW